MKKIQIYLFALFICFPTISFAWSGKVVSVIDGDTIKIIKEGQQIKIRLYGVDTPEKGQAFGQRAKQYTLDMVAGRNVDIESVTEDRYGRTVGLVKINGKSLNEELVKSGYAWVYRKYCDRSFCSEWLTHEESARKNKIGLWQEQNSLPPWEWRRSN